MISLYVKNIECSLKHKWYFSALALALTLPDICGMAEFPEKGVGERYIEWFDRYPGRKMKPTPQGSFGNAPWISGEIVYNLRNTFLHQGSPNVAAERIKEPRNQIDRFTLLVGDGTVLQEMEFGMELGNEETGRISYRIILVDITYLCEIICEYALWYYEENKEKFHFEFDFMTQEELTNPRKTPDSAEGKDGLAHALNRKLESAGKNIRVIEDPERSKRYIEKLENAFEQKEVKQALSEIQKQDQNQLPTEKQTPSSEVSKQKNIDVKNESTEKKKPGNKTSNKRASAGKPDDNIFREKASAGKPNDNTSRKKVSVEKKADNDSDKKIPVGKQKNKTSDKKVVSGKQENKTSDKKTSASKPKGKTSNKKASDRQTPNNTSKKKELVKGSKQKNDGK